MGAPGAGGCGWGQEPLEAPLQAVPQLLQLILGGPGGDQWTPASGLCWGWGWVQGPGITSPAGGGQQCGGHTQEAVLSFKVEPFGATTQFLQGLCWAVGQMPSWTATSCVQLQAPAWDQVGASARHPQGPGAALQDRSCPCYTQPQRRTEQH